jgi:hypothetical protein
LIRAHLPRTPIFDDLKRKIETQEAAVKETNERMGTKRMVAYPALASGTVAVIIV